MSQFVTFSRDPQKSGNSHKKLFFYSYFQSLSKNNHEDVCSNKIEILFHTYYTNNGHNSIMVSGIDNK